MDEMLAALLSFIFELLGEALFGFILGGIFDIIGRIFTALFMPGDAGSQRDKGIVEPSTAGMAARRLFDSILPRTVRATIIYFLMGLSIGWVSLFFLPHPLVHPTRFHGISLLIGPTIAGLMMWWLGASLRKRDKKTTRIESFGYGFVFALGVALMRFFYTD
jgi:hypothetical protein